MLGASMQFFKKLLLVFALVLSPALAHAAVTDCIQTTADGQVNCVQPYFYLIDTHGRVYNTYDDAVNAYEGIFCSGLTNCGLKTDASYPTPCQSAYTCSYYTHNIDDPYFIQAYIFYIGYKSSISAYYVNGDTLTTHSLCNYSYTQKLYGTGASAIILCVPPYSYSTNPVFSNNVQKNTGCPECDAKNAIFGQSTQPSIANPINLTNGNHYETVTDFSYDSTSPISFTRSYNSQLFSWSNNLQITLARVNSSYGDFVTLNRQNGNGVTFKNDGTGNFTPYTQDVTGNVQLTGTGYTYLNPNNDIETYDNNGRIRSISQLGGQQQIFNYNSNGILSNIIDQYGNQLNVTFSTISGCTNQIGTLNFVPFGSSTGLTYSYTYNSNCLLTKVTYPDSTYQQYTYAGDKSMASFIDENLNTYESWTDNTQSGFGYITTSRALGSSATINKYTFTYTPNSGTVKDGLGNSNTINNVTYNGIRYTAGSSTICEDCNGLQAASTSYDSAGNLLSSTDFNGNLTQYTFNISDNLHKDLPLSITEAAGTALARTTSMTYNSQFRLPATVTEPVSISSGASTRVSTPTYDSNGNLTNLSIVAPDNDGTTNTTTKNWQFTYNTLNQLTQIQNPRGFNETYTYSPTGQIATITNALSQTVTLSNYDTFGSPRNILLPDNTSLILTYDSRGKVLTRNYQGAVVSFTYDNAQELTQITYPSGNYNQMVYDSAHRLTTVKEYDENGVYLGGTVFTLDIMSNVTGVNIYDKNNHAIRTTTAQYDNKNRLYKVIGSLNQTTTYTYDPNSNISQITDGRNHNVNSTYDALNRLATFTAQDGGQSSLTYDNQDNLVQFKDPKNLNTGYTYDGFNNLIIQNSPDTGTTRYSYDLNNNVISQTDAKGQVSNYTYDSIDRLTNVTYIGHSTENVTLTYDSCLNGVGKLCSMTDKTGTLNFTYDQNGRLASREFIKGTIDKTVSYNYNVAGQVTHITYPSGMILNYTYNNDKVVGISQTIAGSTTTILSNGVYEPFNQDISSYTWGNGASYSKSFNLDGMVSSVTTPQASVTNKTYGFDNNYNITAITDPVTPANSATATYDLNNRISTYNYASNTHSYNFNTSYDLTSKTDNTATTSFNYSSTSHQLNSLSGAQTDTISTDLNGNVTGFNGLSLSYDPKNRLSSLTDSNSLTTTYSVNYAGQRTEKTNTNNTSYFVYDAAGALIGDYDSSGNVQNEYIYLNGNPVALMQNNNLYYVYDDHLGTPRTITDTANNVQWTWENSEAFGNNQPVSVVSGFTFNLRFPGQYFDNESNLSYNINRDYNSNWGRYVESDPTGLAGGLNTYGYIEGNSLSNWDYWGYSSSDIEKIISTFHSTIEELINTHQRMNDHGAINKALYVFNNALKYDICIDQAQILKGKLDYMLNHKQFDDNWKFQVQSGAGHFWLVGLSSNLKDPILYLDPWKNDYSTNGKPCTNGCHGYRAPWTTHEFTMETESTDYAIIQYNNLVKNNPRSSITGDANGWYQGYDLTRPLPNKKE